MTNGWWVGGVVVAVVVVGGRARNVPVNDATVGLRAAGLRGEREYFKNK